MRNVVVLGVGQSRFGRFPQISASQLGREAMRNAIKDSGIWPKDLQVAYCGRSIIAGSTTGQDILQNFGVVGIEINNVENACASGMTAANLLYRDIASGFYDVGIAIGVEAMTGSRIAGGLLANDEDIDGKLGLSMPGYFALLTKRFMNVTGASIEDIAYPSWKNHKNGCLNPYAMYKKEMSVEEILAGKVIADPLTVYECCPTTDGAAAVILCSEEFAKKYAAKTVQIRASKMLSASYNDPAQDMTGFPMMQKLSSDIYEMAGIGPEDLDCIELHDAFSPEELWAYSDLGLCKLENVVDFIRSGATELGGKCPVNPSGGLLSLGHPLGASGVRVICEIALQLREDAGEHQVEGAKVGMAQMMGGFLGGVQPPVAEGIMILSA